MSTTTARNEPTSDNPTPTSDNPTPTSDNLVSTTSHDPNPTSHDPASPIYRHGVIIGRFNPPHLGHCFLIRVAARHSRKITLFVCSTPSERIPGKIRVRWLQELFPAATIVHIATSNSKATRGAPGALRIWADTIRARISPPPIDALFASEEYGDELARLLGVHFVNVDSDRRTVPISGRILRANPLRYRHYLPEVVRRSMADYLT